MSFSNNPYLDAIRHAYDLAEHKTTPSFNTPPRLPIDYTDTPKVAPHKCYLCDASTWQPAVPPICSKCRRHIQTPPRKPRP